MEVQLASGSPGADIWRRNEGSQRPTVGEALNRGSTMTSASPPRRVCVTGGGGFIASWLVKLLLSRGYAVHATVRDPSDPKNAHLRRLEGAPESLLLFKADVLDRDALAAAVAGCEGVFHVASPVPADKVVDPESEVLAPAAKGTLNVLQACSANNVQKVVVVSSTAAVHYNPTWPQGRVKDESCWSDRNLCMKNEDWYSAAKTIAEETALEYGEKNGLLVVTVCPCIVLGPLLNPVVNTTSELLIYIIKGGPSVMKNVLWNIVDVRDVADALLLVYEKVESSGRYICAPDRISTKGMVNLLKKTYPNYNYVECDDEDYASAISRVSSEKLTSLGWRPRKMEETLCDSVGYYEQAGLVQDVEGRTCRLPHIFHFASDK
ncbi:phenylacetaldehyde reductase-like [Panicum virgatum]|uniref:phenylacetaldehyde reductase-like n=1 Tax=Panicum virgatum TaxID=38727 RepID=UPI0019D4F333|nr:phenylacetaldehyde reductase-like [Panicum virgatum]